MLKPIEGSDYSHKVHIDSLKKKAEEIRFIAECSDNHRFKARLHEIQTAIQNTILEIYDGYYDAIIPNDPE